MPNLVCQFCKKPIYAAGGSEGYFHAKTKSHDCATPQHEGLKNRATPYDSDTTYVVYRAELITEIANTFFSYAEAESPEQLLDMLLADARHFADVHGLPFAEHDRRSYEIYLENLSEGAGQDRAS